MRFKEEIFAAILPHALRHKGWCEWVVKKVYPVLLKHVEDQKEGIRMWAIQMISKVATCIADSSIKDEIDEKLLDVWFSSSI